MNELDKFVMDYYCRDHIPFVNYLGEGRLILQDQNELECKFIAKQFTDGETLLICYVLPISIHQISIERWKTDVVLGKRFVGQTTDGKFFEALEVNSGERLIQDDPLIVCAVFVPREFRIGKIENASFDSISFGITNFLFKGTPYKNESYTEYIDISLAGKCVSIWKNKDYDNISMFMKLRNKQHITSEMWADIAELGEIEDMENKIKDLCYILSVGSGSKVQWIFENVWAKGSLVYARHLLVPHLLAGRAALAHLAPAPRGGLCLGVHFHVGRPRAGRLRRRLCGGELRGRGTGSHRGSSRGLRRARHGARAARWAKLLQSQMSTNKDAK